ncbi:FtsK/SpoIIIE domain-containing protein, partial [Streptococcus oricebi]|uniref:FtsK/SpoIIIE domain-containing protein n=1 Tax=Streptococcus oricebi TaxID=1547447 RepID=UPI001FDA4AC8
QGIEDHTIYLINDIGQYEILNEDLSGLEAAETIREVPTELEAIVDQMDALTQSLGIADLPQPWLPPLAERMTLEEIRPLSFKEAWQSAKQGVSILLGVADIPQEQKQEPVSINLTKDGNVLLYGAPGTGKTTFLQSTAMDLARNYSPEEVVLYLLDFGTNGLAPLGSLPHVADLMLLDQGEKIAKFVRILEQELARRKKLLSDYGVGTMELYRQTSGKEEPTLVILLDSFEAMRDEAFEPALQSLLMRVSREGLSIGVHLVMTAGRQSNLRATLYSNFKHQLTLKQNDSSEVRSIVGSTPLATTMEDIKGRALMKRHEVDVVQFALPVAGHNDIQVVENLRTEAQTMREAWQGSRPSAIPMVPEELEAEVFYASAGVARELAAERLPMGLDMETVQTVSWEPKKGPLAYVAGTEEQMNAMTEHIIKLSQKIDKQVVVLAPPHHLLPDLTAEGVDVLSGAQEVTEMIEALSLKVDERLEAKEDDYLLNVIIYNMAELVNQLDTNTLTQLTKILDRGYRIGYVPIVITTNTLSSRIDVASKYARNLRQGIVSVRLNDQQVVPVTTKPLREPQLDYQVSYLVHDGVAKKMKTIIE